ncbi:MAG: peptidase, partial [bacterium]
RARKVFRFTIDVSDLIPVTLGEVRSWSSPN